MLDDYGLIRVAEREAAYRYAVVAPQCPADLMWPDIRQSTLSILDAVIKKHAIDKGRVFLTGFSMGGNGVWDLAAKTNGIFAAAAPIAGWYNKDEAVHLTSIPIWAFHCEEDDVVPITETESMVQALTDHKGSPRFTRYQGFGHQHSVMYETYSNPALYTWFERNRIDS
ncbi:hypothetical protein XYCOK13_24890 [Xylanibacillus composti]|uniref:Dienelactone hydrolase domain-containing protein n=2 Tax=Xylanibacillus composti TaxID=1572762 RepID=A0A8J4M326_9BACL|nr:hypothetical protein XYCOK13_24890 [Xylanibacillus composti]